jgi:hypothetical protein
VAEEVVLEDLAMLVLPIGQLAIPDNPPLVAKVETVNPVQSLAYQFTMVVVVAAAADHIPEQLHQAAWVAAAAAGSQEVSPLSLQFQPGKLLLELEMVVHWDSDLLAPAVVVAGTQTGMLTDLATIQFEVELAVQAM